MKPVEKICVGLLFVAAVPLWSQVDNSPIQSQPVAAYGTGSGTENTDTQMLVPPPVSGQSYPQAPTSQERSNYLRGGVTFSSAYSDNVLGTTGSNSAPVSEVSYSVFPTLALNETTTRLHWTLTYAPGFTFYQKTSSRNEADQNAAIDFQYRLSPHVTFSARDGFQKTSSVFNQPSLGTAGAVSGGIQEPNQSVIAPVASQLNNFGNVGITYQFAANGMIGASGTFTNLHYLDPAEVQGLFDSSSQGGSAFYAYRISKMHYIGVAYQYQRLLSYPAPGTNQTQTHSLLLLYTLYATPRFSISFFGGPQYADIGPQFSNTGSIPSSASQSWHPEAGGSLSWQGRISSLAVSYSHMVSSGGGLIGAVQTDSASASIRQQFSRTLSGSVTGGYAQNDVLAATPLASSNGHTVSGTASVQQLFGQHLNVQLGYTRLHQDYSTVAVLASTPNTNREFISISYQFSRPLGR
jgi:hypothetical protein